MRNVKYFYYFRWNDLISTSYKTMKKFHFKINLKDTEGLGRIYSYRRQLASLEVFRDVANNPQQRYIYSNMYDGSPDIEFMRRYFRLRGSKLRKLVMRLGEQHGTSPMNKFRYRVAFCSSNERFCSTLRCLKILQHLEIDEVCLRDATARRQVVRPARLLNLKHLKISDSDWSLFTCIKAPKLESLIVIGSGFYDTSPEHLVSFLKDSPKLQSIEFRQNVFEGVFSGDITEFPFKLKRFIYTGISSSLEYSINLNTFLESQTTLVELRTSVITASILQTIFGKLKSLKQLYMTAYQQNEPKEFYYRLPRSRSIIEVRLNETSVPRWILTKCPRLVILNGIYIYKTHDAISLLD